jgi:Uncharacterized conserved protein
MDFLNHPVLPESLPRAEAVELKPLSPDYLKVMRWQWLISMFILLAILGILFSFIPTLQQPLPIAMAGGGWLLVAVAWYVLMHKSFANKGYAIRDKDVIYRTGWIVRTTHTCPFNRIQHSTVAMGPLERQYGLARLVLFTAGSSSADMRLPGLTQEEAQNLKEWITKKIADEPTGQL